MAGWEEGIEAVKEAGATSKETGDFLDHLLRVDPE